MVAEVVSLPLIWETPLRTGNLRDPNGPQVTFASESFIDELAVAAEADPVQFRLKMFNADKTDDNGFRRARSIAVVKTAAETFGWDTRPSPRRVGSGNILTGRGIAYTYRGQTIVAVIAATGTLFRCANLRARYNVEGARARMASCRKNRPRSSAKALGVS